MCLFILLLEARIQAIYFTSLNRKERHLDQSVIEIAWKFLCMYDFWRLGLKGSKLINNKKLWKVKIWKHIGCSLLE